MFNILKKEVQQKENPNPYPLNGESQSTLPPQGPPAYSNAYSNSTANTYAYANPYIGAQPQAGGQPQPQSYGIPNGPPSNNPNGVPPLLFARQRNAQEPVEDPFLLFRQVALTIIIPAILGLIAFGVYSSFFVPADVGFIPAAQFADFCIVGQFCRVCVMCQMSYFSLVSQISIVSVFSMISVGSFAGMGSLIGFYSMFTGINLKVSCASVFKLTSLSDIFPSRGKIDDNMASNNGLA